MRSSGSSKTYEMLWDCKFCGTKKLLGKTHRFCPTCGAAQDPATRYFPSDDEKVAVEDHQYVGADLICPACGATNSGSSAHCTSCGAPLENAKRAGTLAAQEKAAHEKFESSGPRDVAREQMEADLAPVRAQAAAAQSQRSRILIIGGVVVAVVAIIALIAFLMSTQQSSVIVTGHTWERTIAVERFGPLAGSEWRESVPADAYNVTCRQEVRSYRQVPDGEECNRVRIDQGDGTFREETRCRPKYRDEPVYDSRCAFTVNRWSFDRTLTASGKSLNDTPVWPDTSGIRTGTCMGCERETSGGRREAYNVLLKDSQSDRTFTCTFNDMAAWQAMPVESAWQMEVRRTGQPLCDTLKRQG